MNADQIADLYQKLETRKIAGVLKAWGWVPFERYDPDLKQKRTGWSYPLWGEDGQVLPERKWKAGDKLKPKNVMLYKKPDFPYYLPPGTLDAIKSSCEVWIAEGEPDVATLHTLGIQNALCWLFGAGNIPKTLIADLKRWGVFRVYHCPDQDDAGYLSALDLDELLADQGFSLKTVRVDGAINSHHDLNDMLMAKGEFDPRKLPAWTIQELKALTDTKPLHGEPRPQFNPPRLDFELNPRIAQALEAEARRQAGGRRERMIDGSQAIPVMSLFNREEDAPGEHAFYFLDSHSYADYGEKKRGAKWIGTKDLVKYWSIDVEGLGGWTEKPLERPTAHSPKADSEVEPTPASDMFITQTKVMQDWNAYFRNEEEKPDLLILKNPFPYLHQYGGFAKFLTEGMVMGILGMTGGKKSILMENLIDQLLIDGATGFLIGGEWTPQLSGAKAIQRHSDVTMEQMFEDMIARALQARGKSGVEWDAQRLNQFDRMRVIQASSNLARQHQQGFGELIHYNAKYTQTPFDVILEQVQREITLRRARKQAISFVALDYVSLYNFDSRYKGLNMPEEVLKAFKLFCVNNRVVGLLNSQITKTAQKEVTQGGDIGIFDALGMRGDALNFAITIENVVINGRLEPYKKITILKNSMGRTDYFYLNDAPQGNHMRFILEGEGIADRTTIDALIYDAKVAKSTKQDKPL